MSYLDENKIDLRVSVIKQIFILHRKLGNITLKVFESDNLTRTELTILLLLKKTEYKATDLAKELGIPCSTLTGVIDRLIKKGYVERDRSEKDRRVVIIKLGPKMWEKVEKINEKLGDLVQMAESDLSEEWWRQMSEGFNKLEKFLEMENNK